MKLVEQNHNVLKYEFNYIFYSVISLSFVTIFMTCLAYLCTDRTLECRYISSGENQCAVTTAKPFFPYYQPKIEQINNPTAVKMIPKAGKIVYYDIRISNSSTELVFPGYSNKNFALEIQKKVEQHINKYQQKPLIFERITSKGFDKLAILYLCYVVYQFCSPIIVNCEVNKKENLIVVTNKYFNLTRKQHKFPIDEIKIISKGKHRKKLVSIYIETKQGRKMKIKSKLSEKSVQQIIDRIDYFIRSDDN